MFALTQRYDTAPKITQANDAANSKSIREQASWTARVHADI